MRPATAALHGGLEVGSDRPFVEGPMFASTYHLSGDPTEASRGYGRFTNPTWTALEGAISELERGTVRVFPSGMAAIAAVMCALVKPGQTLVLPSDGYFATRTFAQSYLANWGVRVVEAPTADNAQAAMLDGAAMLWLETPTNPHLNVCDIAALCDLAHTAGAIVVVDNTTATPFLQTPLALGADVSVASDTKAMNGHSDILLGHVASRDPQIIEAITNWRTLSGSIPGPMEAWLGHRGLATIGVRVDQQQRTAQQVAEMLDQHPAASNVRYPGLPSDPSHTIATRQMDGYGTIIGFCLDDKTTAARFLDSAGLIYDATSFGGVHTTAERRGRWGTDDVPEGFIRLSVGCEHPDDLLEAISRALQAARRTRS